LIKQKTQTEEEKTVQSRNNGLIQLQSKNREEKQNGKSTKRDQINNNVMTGDPMTITIYLVRQ
jgi:hypothetical protein